VIEVIANADGSRKYNESVDKTLEVAYLGGNLITFTIEENLGDALSSNMEDYLPGNAFRWYRIILNHNGKSTEEFGLWLRTDPAMAITSVADDEVVDLETAVSQAILAEGSSSYRHLDNPYQTEAHVTLKTVENGGSVTVYAHVLSLAYVFDDDRLREEGGHSGPAAITFEKDTNGAYRLAEYWTPKDGSYYMPSIQEKFPSDLWDKVNTQLYAEDCSITALRKAQRYFGLTDFTKPEITVLRALEVQRGTTPDWSEYFEITDDTDGAIPLSEAYYWDTLVDFDTPGRYSTQLVVRDKAGNENRSSYEITVT
jgi:hypothetical protein